jgi:hypothetical protein
LRGWIAVNLFFIGMIGVAAGMLFLALRSVQALALPIEVERALMAFVAVAVIVATGFFGKVMLGTLEKRSRAR